MGDGAVAVVWPERGDDRGVGGRVDALGVEHGGIAGEWVGASEGSAGTGEGASAGCAETLGPDVRAGGGVGESATQSVAYSDLSGDTGLAEQ